jgi:hypothetical protein
MTQILERIAKGSNYFQEKIQTVLVSHFDNVELETDNKELHKKATNISQTSQGRNSNQTCRGNVMQ